MKKKKNPTPHLRLVTYLKIHQSFLLVNNEISLNDIKCCGYASKITK